MREIEQFVEIDPRAEFLRKIEEREMKQYGKANASFDYTQRLAEVTKESKGTLLSRFGGTIYQSKWLIFNTSPWPIKRGASN